MKTVEMVGQTLQISNPLNGAVLGEVKVDHALSIHTKFASARAAQGPWAARPLAERCACIAQFKSLVAEEHERLALILTQETGKPIAQSRNELTALAGRIDFFLNSVAALSAEERVQARDAGVEEVISHEALGVVTCISAWNYPWFVGSNVFVPALLTGNAVLYKPSEYATLTGVAIAELLHRAGVPHDVFALVIGAGSVGALLLEEPADGVYFTGSYATGRAIATRVASRMCRVQLELGGKDPTYVTDDVDVNVAAESLADGAMYNAGQSCCSVERIYVHEKVADAFEQALVRAVQGFRMGAPEDAQTYLGPLARAAQLDVLEAQVRDAREKGGHVACGGQRGALAGPYFEATVVLAATQDMKLMREESFGPIVGVTRVKSDAEAVALMNDTDYGLTAGVYCRDEARAKSVMSQVNAGSVYWNCCDRVSPRLPWSGRGHSGLGTTLSTYGIRSFQRTKAWHLRQG